VPLAVATVGLSIAETGAEATRVGAEPRAQVL
jgi:hypothetical protein